MQGVRHLIQCRCILPQFKNRKEIIFHKFVVFSVIDDNDVVKIKYASCNNCGAVHKITDICQSEIVPGKESVITTVTKDDLKFGISSNIISILETYDCDLSAWEEVQFILENEIWNSSVVIARENMGDSIQGKLLIILGSTKIKIESFNAENVIISQGR